MTRHVALLRAVNVGGATLLPMRDLTALCVGLGFDAVGTYIQSGNVVFDSDLPEPEIVAALEAALLAALGKPVDAFVRTGTELKAVLDANPFPDAEPAKVAVAFRRDAPPPDLLGGLVISGPEQVRLGVRELYILYPDGMGRSKLKLPGGVRASTARNLNTVGKLAALAAAR